MTCANLAVLAGDEGHYQEAEALGRRSLRILEAALGPENAEVGLTLLNLAVAVADQDAWASCGRTRWLALARTAPMSHRGGWIRVSPSRSASHPP
jgi:hypothetical protein